MKLTGRDAIVEHEIQMNVADFKQKYSFVESFNTYPGSSGAVYDEHKLEYLKLCFALHLYWIGPIRDHSPGLLRFCDRAWELIGPRITHFRDNKKRRNPGKLTKKTFDVLRSWLVDPDHAPPMMALLDFFDKRFDMEASDTRLDFDGLDFRGGGHVGLYLPPELVESDPSRFASVFAELANTFEFCSGLAGYGLSAGEGEGLTVAEREFYAIGRHHPGIDVRSTISNGLGQGIKGVNWLSFLHPNFVERLGGRVKLGSALENVGADVFDLQTGVMIQAGEAPEIGDTNCGLNCPMYHAVGQLLSDIRDRSYPPIIGDERGIYVSQERTDEWLSRFD